MISPGSSNLYLPHGGGVAGIGEECPITPLVTRYNPTMYSSIPSLFDLVTLLFQVSSKALRSEI
jgi:hypothetical protein